MWFLCFSPLSHFTVHTSAELRTHFSLACEWCRSQTDCHRATICMFDHWPQPTSPSGITSRGDEASKNNTLLVFSSPLFFLFFFVCISISTLSLSPHPLFLFSSPHCASPFFLYPSPPSPHTHVPLHSGYMHLSLLWGFCMCVCARACVCSWSPAAVCAPDSAQLLLHSGGGLEVFDHPGLSAPHHRLLPRPADTAERLHRRLLRPAATQRPGEVENILSLEKNCLYPITVCLQLAASH